MHPDAWQNLLFNLKLQYLALPSLLRWGVLTVAGIVVLREAITAAWRLHQRRQAPALPDAGGPASGRAGSPQGPAIEDRALPAPDPFAPDFNHLREAQRSAPSTPADGTGR